LLSIPFDLKMEAPDFKSLAIKKKRKKILIILLATIFVIAIMVAVYPFLPLLKYKFFAESVKVLPGESEEAVANQEEIQDIASVSEIAGQTEIKTNLLIIPKIGVRIPIVEGDNETALNRGAWRLPETSTPDKGNNTAIAGHRWKYRPPSEKTFYLLDKVEIGDSFQIFWQGEEYDYRIVSVDVVLPTDVWVLNPTTVPTITLITCTPLFSTAKRLIVKGELAQ